ncbi:MAG: DUF4394 domain-containing protein [Anaerolineae bacterium]|nr:DUF4394 domain-containing protein [Gloeobacterales cyanobacterium ES-bin-313]
MAVELIALSDTNVLIRFEDRQPSKIREIKPSGLKGKLIGIDFRPANGLLYGLSNQNILYTIDPDSGVATEVTTLTVPFSGNEQTGFDFNPSADRLRIVSGNGQDLRVNVNIGATAVDGTLAYAKGDRNAGKRPGVTATAYTNSISQAESTKMYNIDAALDVLVLQDPPNDGVLKTVGALGVDFAPEAGFDIFTDREKKDRAFAVTGSTLYTIDLATGAAAKAGTVGNGRIKLIGLAAVLTR